MSVHQPTGRESLVERWILARLETCASELNKHLEGRSFLLATKAIYDFWLYELCDIFIEAMKPLSSEDAPADTRASAQATLYTCLDHGLRMLHPFMPFVTEELWQRLPRRPEDSTISIALASFPLSVSRLLFAHWFAADGNLYRMKLSKISKPSKISKL